VETRVKQSDIGRVWQNKHFKQKKNW
jgi:hypothetical protein